MKKEELEMKRHDLNYLVSRILPYSQSMDKWFCLWREDPGDEQDAAAASGLSRSHVSVGQNLVHISSAEVSVENRGLATTKHCLKT